MTATCLFHREDVVTVITEKLISFNRFIVIVFPMRSRSLCTLSNCRKAILFVWLSATILSMPVMLIKVSHLTLSMRRQVSQK